MTEESEYSYVWVRNTLTFKNVPAIEEWVAKQPWIGGIVREDPFTWGFADKRDATLFKLRWG